MRDAEEIGRDGLAEIRRYLAALRDRGEAGLTPTPGAFDVAAASTVDLHVIGDLTAVDVVVGLVVFRVVQESLMRPATRRARRFGCR